MDSDLKQEENVYRTLETAVKYAWEAYHAQDWQASFARWEHIRELWPDYPPPYVHAAKSLGELGQNEDAASLLKAGAAKFPLDCQIAREYALRILKNGDYATASSLLEEALGRFPNNPEVGIDFLKIASDLEDYKDAMRRVPLVSAAYPTLLSENAGLRSMVSHAHHCLQLELLESDKYEDLSAGPRVETTPLYPASTQDLLLGFESLGENCEFGLVQRHFGIEPLGLLRWAAISPYSLTLALTENFATVGQPEHTRLIAGGGEYMSAHTVYGMGSHTFIKVNPANEEKIRKDQLKRLQYLRRKLIEDLQTGSKIFVYHCEIGASPEELAKLHEAIGSYGSRYVLYVRKFDEQHPPGTLEVAENGLMIGYIERLGPDRRVSGDHWNIAFDTWVTLCEKAYRARHDAEHGGVDV